MDYKYIEQLLERYWLGDTTLQEERILKAFFSQEDVPAELRQYRSLFAYEQQQAEYDVLGNDFDERMKELVSESKPRAHVVSIAEKLMPLFKAAAIVAIFLTLGNAAQRAFEAPADESESVAAVEQVIEQGRSVAMSDSVKADTLKKAETQEVIILK